MSQALFPAWRPRAAEAERLQPVVRTLHGQLRERGLPPQAWLDGIDCAAAGTFVVDRFELLFNPGGRYEALGCWTLAGTGLPRAPEQGTLL